MVSLGVSPPLENLSPYMPSPPTFSRRSVLPPVR